MSHIMEDKYKYTLQNKEAWNKRTLLHFDSEFYDVEGFLNGNSSLKNIEMDILNNYDLKCKNILHLQCHFGQDTLSLTRLGANVTGIDISDTAISYANKLKEKMLHHGEKINADFICCNVFELPSHLDKKFDIIYTSYGVLGWLHSMDEWAKIISHFLKPGGILILVEFHPFIWLFNENDYSKIIYSYFNRAPIIETKKGTYTDPDNEIEITDVQFSHTISDVLSSLIKNGMRIKDMKEYDHSPYGCFNELDYQNGKYHMGPFGDKLPYVFSVIAEME